MNSDVMGVTKERNTRLKELKEQREQQISQITNEATAQESQIKSALEAQSSHYQGQLDNVSASIGQIETALGSGGLPSGEVKKLKKQLEKLRAHRSFLQAEIFRLKVRMQSRINQLWFHVRTQKEFINQNMDNQRSFLLKKYADLLTRLTNNSMIERANARSQQRGPRPGAGKKPGGSMMPGRPKFSADNRGEMQSTAG